MQRGFVRVFLIFLHVQQSLGNLGAFISRCWKVSLCQQDMETDAVTLPGNGVGLHGLVDLRCPAVHAVQLVCVCEQVQATLFLPSHTQQLYPPTPADARGSAPGNKTFEDIWPSTTTTATTTTTMQAAAGSSRQQAAVLLLRLLRRLLLLCFGVAEYWQKTRL